MFFIISSCLVISSAVSVKATFPVAGDKYISKGNLDTTIYSVRNEAADIENFVQIKFDITE